jgi:hypothetical protein
VWSYFVDQVCLTRRVPNQIGSDVERAEMGFEDLRRIRRTTQRKESREPPKWLPRWLWNFGIATYWLF